MDIDWTWWDDYTQARDQMFQATDTPHAPWYVIRSDSKKKARLNCISHLLNLIPFEEVSKEKVKLPKRSKKDRHDSEAGLVDRQFVPEVY